MPLLAKEKNHVRWETVLDIMQSLPTVPSEEFELTANSLGAHIETRVKLLLRTLSYISVNSQVEPHCELSVSLQLTELAVSYSKDHPMSSPCSGSSELTV